MLIKAVGFNLLQRAISRKMASLRNRRAVNRQATVVVDRWIQENFKKEGKPAMGGRGWRPLSAVTLAHRRRGPSQRRSKILQDTGTMKTRWKHSWTANLAKVQSGVDYADDHHYGKGWLPVRRILPREEQIWPRLRKLYENFIGKELKA